MWISRIVCALSLGRHSVIRIVISNSDFNIMNKTVELAKQNGVKVGAHPSLPDLQGFGRREMAIEPVSLVQDCLRVEFSYPGP
jgi:lactam utilization protein B